MTRLEALKGSLDKWEDICNSKLYLGFTGHICSLCHNYIAFGDGCKMCPLLIDGHGCLAPNSMWNLIVEIVHDNNYNEYTLIETGNKRLKILCNNMKNTIKKLYKEELNKVSQRDTNKENKMERTLRQLTEGEKQMTRALVKTMCRTNADYTDTDIARAMNVTLRTVAAVRAHETMGSYK